ncbi:uncharacterized protein TrAFT101_011108 [Trichoderma asperellum]|uniref:uncharacterized protein n=1 Tax=Trichoderma asperellum TaxID=101201 RepID=UPI003317CCAC|nr:hypothetical protein TrAFT101_011108 [Trichoderma asperellum]
MADPRSISAVEVSGLTLEEVKKVIEGVFTAGLESPAPEPRHTTLNHTALFAAAEGGELETVKVLIRYGANMDALCGSAPHFDTPMTVAKKRHKSDVLAFLLEARTAKVYKALGRREAMRLEAKITDLEIAIGESPMLLDGLAQSDPTACVPGAEPGSFLRQLVEFFEESIIAELEFREPSTLKDVYRHRNLIPCITD